MTLSENIAQEAYDYNLKILEIDMRGIDGAFIGDTIYLEKSYETYKKNRVARHELEHAYTCPINLMTAPKPLQKKFEAIADRRSVLKLVPLDSLIEAFENGIRTADELSQALEIDDEFLYKALSAYDSIYGYDCKYKGYNINFMPLRIKKEDKEKNGSKFQGL